MTFAKLPPLEKIRSVRSSRYFLNVATSNKGLQNKPLNLGLIETQRTYVLANDDQK